MTRGRRVRLGAMVALLALASGGAMLVASEWLLRWTGAGFEPMRSRPHADETLERSEFSVRVVTNALGFRETRAPRAPADGTTRVVAIGDSFTQGYGVEVEERFTNRLERLLEARGGRPVEVINLGVPGASPPDYLHHLRTTGLAYEPDVVLIGFMANDVNDVRALLEQGTRGVMGALREVRARLTDARPAWKRLPQALLPTLYDLAGTAVAGARTDVANAAPPGVAPPAPRRETIPDALWMPALLDLAERYERRDAVAARVARLDEDRRAALREVVTGRWHFEDEVDQAPFWLLLSLVEPDVYRDSVLLPARYDAAWERTARDLGATIDAARGAGAAPVLLFIPAAHQVMPETRAFLERSGFSWDDRLLTDTTLGDRVAALGERHGVPVIDLAPALRAARRGGEPLYYVEDGHWTPAGHALAARTIAGALELP